VGQLDPLPGRSIGGRRSKRHDEADREQPADGDVMDDVRSGPWTDAKAIAALWFGVGDRINCFTIAGRKRRTVAPFQGARR